MFTDTVAMVLACSIAYCIKMPSWEVVKFWLCPTLCAWGKLLCVCLSTDCSGVSPPATTIFLIFLVFEGLLFGIFTAIMCGSQLSAICADETVSYTIHFISYKFDHFLTCMFFFQSKKKLCILIPLVLMFLSSSACS